MRVKTNQSLPDRTRGCAGLRIASRRLLLLGVIAMALMPGAGWAFPAYHGRKRVLVVLAPGDQHNGLLRQRSWIGTQRTALADRDVVVVYVAGQDARSDLGPQPGMSGGAIRSLLRAPEGAFRVLLLGKDGKALLDSGVPVPVTTLIAAIERTPVRGEQARQRAP